MGRGGTRRRKQRKGKAFACLKDKTVSDDRILALIYYINKKNSNLMSSLCQRNICHQICMVSTLGTLEEQMVSMRPSVNDQSSMKPYLQGF